MRKIIFQNMVTVDGYFEGANKEIDWHNVDSEFNELAQEFLNSIDLLLFGRLTYELMASYWPTEAALNDDPVIASFMNSLPKIVFSKTLERVGWENTMLVKDNPVNIVKKLKQEDGKNIAIFGSSDLTVPLVKNGLIDEFRIFISPILLGSGKTILQGLDERVKLKFKRSSTFSSGNVLLYYKI